MNTYIKAQMKRAGVLDTTGSGILDGSITNADINANAAIADTKLATIATALKVSNSATTAASANTASAIVARDASGNFVAGTITAALTGAASTNTTQGNGFVSWLTSSLNGIGTLVISGENAVKFKTTTTAYYHLSGIQYSKAATDKLTFTAADTINTAAAVGSFFGIWLVQINAAGTISTKSPAADQSYTSSALALAALPAVDAGNVALGRIIVNANANSKWTANTDDMTNGSDCVTATFTDATITAIPSSI
jgi:hypothetical protein